MSCFKCQHCDELKNEVIEKNEEKERFIDQVIQAMEDKDEELKQMKKKLEEQEQKCSTQKMRESGSQENTNDEFSNTHLEERFVSSLKRQWLDVCDALQLIINEIQKLTALSGIMEDIVAKVKEDEIVRSILTHFNVPDATVATIERFMYDLADICWLMCIGNPPLKQNFDVKGVDFNKIDNRFVEYAIIENEFSDGKPGAVYLVAWPSLEFEDNTGFLTKGEAIVCR